MTAIPTTPDAAALHDEAMIRADDGRDALERGDYAAAREEFVQAASAAENAGIAREEGR